MHTSLDGDTVFTAATGARALVDSVSTLASLGALAADVLARRCRAWRLHGRVERRPGRYAAILEGPVQELSHREPS